MTKIKEFEDISPNFKKALLEKAHLNAPYWGLLGMKLKDIKKGWAQVVLPYSDKLAQADGIAHGGAIFSPADAAVTMALIGMIGRDETMVTIEMKVNFIKPIKKGDILAEAQIIYHGGRTAIGEVDVKNSDDELIAKCIATYMINKK